MNEITEKDVKRLWVEKDAVCVELKDGRIGRELIRDYEPLRKATRKQLENCRVDCDGVWFDDLDEGLELSGFFSDEKIAVRDDMDTFFLKDLLLLENFRIFIFRQGGRVPT